MSRSIDGDIPNGNTLLQQDSPEPALLKVDLLDPG
jgi:hypothetical protein